MSLFGFAKDIGSRLFTNDANAATEIKEHLEANNPGVSDLSVSYEDGCVELGGLFDDKAAAEKCVLLAGNVKNVNNVSISRMAFRKASLPEAAAAAAETTESADVVTVDPSTLESGDVTYYEIKSGDTLGKIAQEFYGKASAYPKIFEANREVIQDPDKIYVGQKIRIPELS